MTKMTKRILSVVLSFALVLGYIPTMAAAATGVSGLVSAVADPNTSGDFTQMMGTDADGNRYAGRVWVDKSVYTDGDTAVLNTAGGVGASFQVELESDESFQVVFSALGSTMTTTETTSKTGPVDVALVLDTSTSMDDEDSQGVTRLQRTIEAANDLLEDLLTIPNARIAIVTYNNDSETVLPLNTYTNGVKLVVTDYYNNGSSDAGVVTAYDKNNRVLGADDGYTQGTNLQSGIDRGFNILANATGVDGRVPVAIVLTDGQANRASQEGFYELQNHSDKDGTSNVEDRNLYLSTLLNAAYTKTKIEANYGRDATVYTIGVDVSNNTVARLLMNPADNNNGFKDYGNLRNKTEITQAYRNFETWASGRSVTYDRWTFDHNYPTMNGLVTREKIAANIHYVDTYYDVSSADLSLTFEQIYEELTSGAFNPITSTTTSTGSTGVESTPLIYVDFIGQHMEVKRLQSVSLFGASYDVIENDDGTYTVETAAGKNPTTGEAWNTSEDVLITLTRESDGTQKLEVRIHQEILPILLEQVASSTIGGQTTSTITEVGQTPLRVFYTVGLDSEILLPNGQVDISKLQGYTYINDETGTVDFYGSRFGERAPEEGKPDTWDSHAGFQPSLANRYYYHQTNEYISTSITNRKTGAQVTISPNAQYGILWDEDTYAASQMTYAEYLAAQPGDPVYTYVTYYRPTADATDAANAAEEVTYLVYTYWQYLKDSVAFYDATTGKYVNDNGAGGYELAEEGVAMDPEKVQAIIGAYLAANPDAELYAELGIGSLRTSRLHNMVKEKNENVTGTSDLAYAPEYTYETAADHHGNAVVVWMGNNGKLTVAIDTGIALTKNVTEVFGGSDDTYALTLTVPEGTPVVKDAHGNDVTQRISSFSGGVLTVNLTAGQTVYISGIPGGTQCQVGEVIPDGAEYYVAAQTQTVTVPTLSQAMQTGVQYAPASVTNAPYKYGDLTISKDILHNFENTPAAMGEKVFTFQVQLPQTLANQSFGLDKTNAADFGADSVTVDAEGIVTLQLKDAQSVTILGLPDGTTYTVTEVGQTPGYENTTGAVSGVIVANRSAVAHFINTYQAGTVKPQVTVTGTKILVDNHGTYEGGESFRFSLAQHTENGYVTLGTAQANAGGSYTFDLAALLPAGLGLGDHFFRITEEAGATAGMTYDSTRGLFVISVTDENADGTPEYTLENYANTTVSGNTVTKDFTNTYDVARTFADINITKTLTNPTGVNIPLDLFRFRLTDANGAEVYRATTDASGKATIRISDLAEGVYHYTLTEIDGGMAGMRYDSTIYAVAVEVTNQDGRLVAAIRAGGAESTGNTVEVSFANTYELAPTTYTISGEKVLTGRPLQNGEFTFNLYQANSAFEIQGQLQSVKNNGDTFAFDQFRYTQVGTYYYAVEEVAGQVPGVTYDTTHYHIAVTVGIDSQNPHALAVTNVAVHKIGANADTSGQVVFVNTYKAAATEYTLGGVKFLHGRSLRAGEFTFGLYDGDKLVETVTNKADGTFTFSPIRYGQVGDVTYTIREEAGNLPGVRYDGAANPVTVTVSVADQGGELVATADKANTAIRFENTYIPAHAQVSFVGTKTLVGGQFTDGAFTFRLHQTDASFDISQAVAAVSTTNVNGSYGFTKGFDTTGTYFFVVSESNADPVEDVVYDRTQYQFVVQVSDLGDGQLRASVINVTTGEHFATGENVTAQANFVNATSREVTEKEVYYAGSQVTHIDGKKVAAGDVLTYYITYVNYNGQDVVVDIMDTIPEFTSYVEGSASHGASYVGTHLHWVLNVARGQSVTVSFDVKVDETDAIFTNTAIIRDGVNTYHTNEVVNHTVEHQLTKDVYAPQEPTVSIDGKKVYEGDELLYKISFTNASGAIAAVTITDTIPEFTTYVEGSAEDGVYADGALTWNLENIPAWETVTVTFRVTVNRDIGAALIQNQATATDGVNTYATQWVANYTVQDVVTKTVAKAAAPEIAIDGQKVAAGDVLVYTISYLNTAQEVANVTITDTIPAFTSYVEGSAEGGAYENGVLTWNLEVEPGASVSVSFQVKVEEVDGTAITNTATVAEGKNVYATNGVSNPTDKPYVPESPTTGDGSDVQLWYGMMFVSCIGLAVLVLSGKKQEEAE